MGNRTSSSRNSFLHRQTTASSIDQSQRPEFPPPSPHEILTNRAAYARKIQQRTSSIPAGHREDESIFFVYRLYEYLLVANLEAFSKEVTYFWNQEYWHLSDIEDPDDDDPLRYAFLAGIILLLGDTRDTRVKLGYVKDTAKRGKPPQWVHHVKALKTPLFVPDEEGLILDAEDTFQACSPLKQKGIIMKRPDIPFS